MHVSLKDITYRNLCDPYLSMDMNLDDVGTISIIEGFSSYKTLIDAIISAKSIINCDS